MSPLLNGSCYGESGPRGLNGFPDNTIKILVNKTKCNGLLATNQAISILTIYNNDNDGKSRRNQHKQLIIRTQSPFQNSHLPHLAPMVYGQVALKSSVLKFCLPNCLVMSLEVLSCSTISYPDRLPPLLFPGPHTSVLRHSQRSN